MNTIDARKESLFGYDYLCIFVDGERLDVLLSRFSKKEMLLPLIPSWLDLYMGYPEDQMDCIWSATRLDDGRKTLPVLLCPDDFDFGCTTIVVEAIPGAETVAWTRFGLDTTGFPEYIGKTVEWLTGAGPFVFDRRQYCDCLGTFLTLAPDPPPDSPPEPATRMGRIAAGVKKLIFGKPPPGVPARRIPNRFRRMVMRSISPWSEVRFIPVGGLLDMGLDASERFLLVGSTAGRGVFEPASGERVARDRDEESGYAEQPDGVLDGIGPLSGSRVPVYGVCGRRVPDSLLAEAALLDNEVTELKSVLTTRDGGTLLAGWSDGVGVFTRASPPQPL